MVDPWRWLSMWLTVHDISEVEMALFSQAFLCLENHDMVLQKQDIVTKIEPALSKEFFGMETQNS